MARVTFMGFEASGLHDDAHPVAHAYLDVLRIAERR